MAYIKSKDIQLFPSAFRGQYSSSEGGIVFNPASRLTTEYNLTTLSARASRFHQSYVLDYKRDTDDKTIIFNIKGYLFEIKMGSYLSEPSFSSADNIWAKIKLENIAPDDINNTVDTNPVLIPLEGNGTILDELDEGPVGGNFLGLSLEITDPTLEAGEYKLHILEKTGDVWNVPAKSYFRMSAKEISDSGDETKSIDEKFNVEEINAEKINAEKINGLTITPADDAVLTIAEGKELKVSGNNKELAGAGSVLTMGGNLTTSGAHTTTLTTTGDTTLTLPITGTLATLNEEETLTNKTLTSPILTTPTLGVATATSINGLKIDTTTGILDIASGKKLAVNDNITVGTNAITLASGKSLTMQYAGLKIGDSSGTGTVTIKTSGTTGRSLTLTGSPSLSGITTTGSGTLALNTNLTVNGANKIFAGDGTSLTIDNSLDIAGTTAQITLGTNPYTLKFTTTENTTLALPTTGKLATIAGSENLSNKTINGLTLTPKTNGFSISGGGSSKTLTVPASYTLGPACAKDFNDSQSASALSTSEYLVTERDVYYGLPTINNSHSYNSTTKIFAPTTGGTAGYLLKATNATSAPIWVNPSTITVGNATNATNTAFTNANWVYPSVAINGTLPSSVLGKTLEIGVVYGDFHASQPRRYYNFGIITLRPLGGIFSEWYVGAVYARGEIYSLTIDSNGAVYFKNGTTRITDDDYKLHYRIIT